MIDEDRYHLNPNEYSDTLISDRHDTLISSDGITLNGSKGNLHDHERAPNPPSDIELNGKLFNGWYQPQDLTDYKIPTEYVDTRKKQIDMQSIIKDIPYFILSTRNNLPTTTSLPSNFTSTPVPDDQYFEYDNRLLTHTCADCIPDSDTQPKSLYLMLDYLIELSVPAEHLQHFSIYQNRVRDTSPRSRPQSARRTSKRWVFFACHCDVSSCYGNVYHTLDNAIPVLVVSYESYEEYHRMCAKSHVIVRLPLSHCNATGYTKYWIQKIANKLSLSEIWIIDDQVKSFYASVPHSNVPVIRTPTSWRFDVNRISERLVSFNKVMSYLEKVMLQDADLNPNSPISILGVNNEIRGLKESYAYNIPFGAVLLNLKSIKDVQFHPELHQIDMQVFACEAVKAGQRVFVSNTFVLLDSRWDQD